MYRIHSEKGSSPASIGSPSHKIDYCKRYPRAWLKEIAVDLLRDRFIGITGVCGDWESAGHFLASNYTLPHKGRNSGL